MLSVIMLNVAFYLLSCKNHYAECSFAECRGTTEIFLLRLLLGQPQLPWLAELNVLVVPLCTSSSYSFVFVYQSRPCLLLPNGKAHFKILFYNFE
jgi:hypothetical protein